MAEHESIEPEIKPRKLTQPTTVEGLDHLLVKYNSSLDSETKKEQLIHAIGKGEARLALDNGVEEDKIVREITTSTVSIVYHSVDGRTFILEEGERQTAPEGYSHLDLKEKKVSPIKVLPPRKHGSPVSLSETVFAFKDTDQETGIEGSTRGCIEEAFRSPLYDFGQGENEKQCEDFVKNNLKLTRYQLNQRAKDDPNNSYKGLRSKVEEFNYVLEINPEDVDENSLPIILGPSGIPEVLYETEIDRNGLVRYNELVWREINEDEYQQVIKPKITIKSEQGEVESNPREILRKIITNDNKFGEDSYQARKAVLSLTDEEIETWEAFITNPDLVGARYREAKPFLFDSQNYNQNWCEGRRKFHEWVINTEKGRILEFSRRLDYQEPTIIILRGNTGSGKTRFLRNYFDRSEAVINDREKGTVKGVINPDTYKAYIKIETGTGLTGQQLRSEGNFLSQTIESWAMSDEEKKTENELNIENSTSVIFDIDPNFSVAFDRRFGLSSELHGEEGNEKILDKAESKERKVIFIDIDTPLEQSLLWMFTRSVDGYEARVPFDDIKNGFVDNRIERREIIKFIEESKEWLVYRLFVADKGEFVELTDWTGMSQYQIRNLAFASGYNPKELEEIADKIGSQRIRDIVPRIKNDYKHLGEVNTAIILAALETYEGDQTLAFAVTDHANKRE